jgi:hypothetical protein
MDSLRLLLETARAERASQQAHFDALDGKAGLLLGIAGAEIALTPSLPLPWQIPALLCLLGAAASAARGFLPRAMPALDLARLREYLRAEEEFTMLTLHDTLVTMVAEATWEVRAKALRIRVAVVLLAVATPTLVLGIAFGGAHG